MADCNVIPYTIAGIIFGAGSGALATYFVQKASNKSKDEKDSKTIYDWLSTHTSHKTYTYRSTQTIASETNLTQQRVRDICSLHPDIRSPKGVNAKDQWGLRSILDAEEA